jgi:hypothetical protein
MIHAWRNLAHDDISVYVRVMSVAIGVSLFAFGWDLVLNPTNGDLTSPVYDVVRQMAPLASWGVMMWAVAVAYAVAAISGRFVVYALAMVWSVAAQAGWFFGIVWAKVFAGAPLASTSIGLWILALALTIGTAFVPHPLVHGNTTVRVVDEHDNTVVELKRAS